MEKENGTGASCNLVKVQMARGISAVIAMIAAYFAFRYSQPLSYLLLGFAVWAMRGCPFCWIFETCEAVSKRKKEAAGKK